MMDCPLCGYDFDPIEDAPDPNEVGEDCWIEIECPDCEGVFRAKWSWITEEVDAK